jgi:hypothetical protein
MADALGEDEVKVLLLGVVGREGGLAIWRGRVVGKEVG